LQKGDHFQLALLKIIRLFYPNEHNLNWDDACALVNGLYGEDDSFSKVMAVAVPILKLVRNTRNCLEHQLEGVIIKDFELQSNGAIVPPTIEVDFRQSVH
jgi:hypothetical protein